MGTRSFDLVIYGATGFTGRQAARYLDRTNPPGLRWAIAGRSREKLEDLRKRLGTPEVGLIIADASDPASLRSMAEATTAVVSTVGPFRRYGTPLVEACIDAQTHYADITGETPWVRGLIDRLEDKAKTRGVRLVPFSGYDSMPSDLGTFAIAEHTRASRGVGLRRVEAFHSARGGFNGGTLATLLDSVQEGRLIFDPWLLSPGFVPTQAARSLDRDPREVRYHERARTWTAPFVMSMINTRVVRRSAALFSAQGQPYGADFAYQEYWGTRSRLSAYAVLGTVGLLGATVQTSAGRSLVEMIGPKPGEGPSEEAMDAGRFTCRYLAEAEDGSIVSATMRGIGDPGNRSTVRFLIEAGILLSETPIAPEHGGFLTPATAFGRRILERCAAHGLSFALDT
ncbi:MAG: saccharopine dehydrogenase NADP-binding domain-containing protein [Myxococcota bacterium]